MKIVIFILIGLNLTVPFFVLKVAYFDAEKQRKSYEKQLTDIRKKNTSISAFLKKTDAVAQLQNELADEISVLRDLMPPKTEIIEAQKFLSQFAREAKVIIVALRPVEDSIPLVNNVSADDKTKSAEQEGEDREDERQAKIYVNQKKKTKRRSY